MFLDPQFWRDQRQGFRTEPFQWLIRIPCLVRTPVSPQKECDSSQEENKNICIAFMVSNGTGEGLRCPKQLVLSPSSPRSDSHSSHCSRCLKPYSRRIISACVISRGLICLSFIQNMKLVYYLRYILQTAKTTRFSPPNCTARILAPSSLNRKQPTKQAPI